MEAIPEEMSSDRTQRRRAAAFVDTVVEPVSISRWSMGIFAGALAVRLLVLSLSGSNFVFTKYPAAAEMLANGRLSGDRVLDFSPLYLELYRLGALVGIADLRFFMVLQCIIGALSCVLVFRLGVRLISLHAGILAGVLAAGLTDLIVFDQVLEPDSLLLFLTLTVLWLLIAPSAKLDWRRLAALGLCFGLAIAVRPSAWMLLPVVGTGLLLSWRDVECRRRVSAFAAFLLVFALVLTGLTLRNRSYSRHVVLSPWQVFYLGNNPASLGMYSYGFLVRDLGSQIWNRGGGPDPAHEAFRQVAIADGASGEAPDNYWRDLAFAFAGSYPLGYLKLLGQKFLALGQSFTLHDNYGTKLLEEQLSGWPLVPSSLLVPVGLVGLALPRGRLWLVSALAALALGLCVIFYPSARYRLQALPALCIGAAALIAHCASVWRSNGIRKGCGFGGRAWALSSLVAVAVLFVVFRLPFLPGAYAAHSQQLDYKAGKLRDAAVEYAKRGDPMQALGPLRGSLFFSPWSLDGKRLAEVPFPLETMAKDLLFEAHREGQGRNDPWAWLRLGTLLKLADRDEAALEALSRVEAVVTWPDEAPLAVHPLVQIGLIRLTMDQLDEAKRAFQRAASLQPGLVAALVGMAVSSPPSIKRAMLAEAERVNPHAAVRYSYGRLLLEVGRSREALSPLAELVRMLPDYARGHLLYAVALDRSGEIEMAVKHAIRAHELNPRLLDAKYDTLDILKRAAEHAQQDGKEPWLRLAEQAGLNGDFKLATDAWRHLREHGPLSHEELIQAAKMYQSKGDAAGATMYLREAELMQRREVRSFDDVGR